MQTKLINPKIVQPKLLQSRLDLEESGLPATTLPAHVLTTRVPPDLPAVRTDAGRIPLEAIYSLVSLRSKTGGGVVIAFTSARRKEGVTHVVQEVGRQLAAYCREDVLIISPRDLRVLDAELIQVRGQRATPGLCMVPKNLPLLPENDSAEAQEDLWKTLRDRFRYVLFDCSALECSADVLSLAPRVDGTVLVVRAGFTPKPQVQNAARLLSQGPSPFLGCILNERTYPVPEFLYRML